MNFGKVLTAMVTPFNDKNALDLERATTLIEHLITNGTDALVVVGTTGESPTLSESEKLELISHTVKVVNKRIPVIVGTGSNNTASTISFSQKVAALGVDALMLVTPYYNKPSQEGLKAHFKAVANEVSLPIMLYNIPGRSVVKMTAETIIELSKVDNIVSVKEASADLDLASEIIENTPESFSLYGGDDGFTLPVLSIGGHGIVSVASHVLGPKMQEMVTHYVDGQVKEAAKLHRTLLPKMNALFAAPSPAPVKEALRLQGVETGGVRLPLLPLNDDEKSALNKYFV